MAKWFLLGNIICVSYGSWVLMEAQFLIDLSLYPLSLTAAIASLLSRILRDPAIPPGRRNLMPQASRLKQQGPVWTQPCSVSSVCFHGPAKWGHVKLCHLGR